jgi:hypothetical protein
MRRVIRFNEYGKPGGCLGMAWANTNDPVYQIEINGFGFRRAHRNKGSGRQTQQEALY